MLKTKHLDNFFWRFSNLSLSLSYNRSFSIMDHNNNKTPSSSSTITIPPPPKRSSNVFALFVRDCFKRFPTEMPVKERFARAGQEWRQMTPEQKEHYQKMSTEEFVKYKSAMNEYLGTLNDEELAQFKRIKKDQIKTKNRQRIKSKLRELNYPKRSVSSYIFYIRDHLKQEYPDGKYPPVKSPEHLEKVRKWSQNWHQLSPEERKPFDEQAEVDRKRYFEELEQWKHELAKPENEEKFRQLERLSKKMEVANMSEERAELRAKRQRRLTAKIIKKRLMKKAANHLKAKKKAKSAAAKKKSASKAKKSTTAHLNHHRQRKQQKKLVITTTSINDHN
ncbi:hypothetical protein DERP_008017 [Dermatophagoides pteronyssinus]|uniref:HMG box domain-containing protein n=1 Tax=Dermatophagoides pteronyssinus TaxID=6956 RepID=A0ABQ8IT92_DERPT|nr:hypothetical protein DERP_008017 [Dermatophagoides pteronyssinus]